MTEEKAKQVPAKDTESEGAPKVSVELSDEQLDGFSGGKTNVKRPGTGDN